MTESKDHDKPPSGKPETGPEDEEIGGPKGPEHTRYGEWEIGGRVVDF